MLKNKSDFLLLLLIVLAFELFVYGTTQTLSNGVVTHDQYKISSFELNNHIDFCGEKVPLHSQDILERYEYEIVKNAHWHSEIILLYKRSGKFFPMIEKLLKEYEIPDDFKYLCVIESGLSNAVSPVGASGFWQIMKKTGQEYGLEINKDVDERYHLEKATRVACKYFKRAYAKFGSWTLVAASYNMGISGVAKRLKKQKVNSYYDLLLNRETSRYVFRILALKEIMNHPEKFNFSFDHTKKYQPVPLRYESIDTSVSDLVVWSLTHGINYKILKIFNPWLKSERIPNKVNKSYQVAVPTGKIYRFSVPETDTLDQQHAVVDSVRLSTVKPPKGPTE